MPIASTGQAATAVVRASENVLFLSPRDIDLATLSASTAVSSLPVANLQNQEPTKVWRTTSALDQYVDITFASPVAADAAAMAGFRKSASLLWRAKAYASAADRGGAAALDTGWQSPWPQGYMHNDPAWGPEVALMQFENDTAYQFWRVEFTDPAATYLDIGRLAVGPAAQFSVNPDYESAVGFVSSDVAEPNGYGQIFTDPRPYLQRQFDMPWTALGRSEANTLAMELTRLRGLAGDIFCFLDPGETEHFHRWSMQGLFTGAAKYSIRPMFNGERGPCWGFTFAMIQKL